MIIKYNNTKIFMTHDNTIKLNFFFVNFRVELEKYFFNTFVNKFV